MKVLSMIILQTSLQGFKMCPLIRDSIA